MKILGIDTSCDDTCVSILESGKGKLEILSNVISSQVKLHAVYGGVYPALAKREHQRNLPIVFKKALKKTGFLISNFQFPNPKQVPIPKSKISNIDLVAVTVGPGLEPCLWQGVNFAKELAKSLNRNLIPVNHIEAHILANFLTEISLNFQFSIFNFQKTFPAVCLVVSGGHTQLILMKEIGSYKLIGETRDDAAGECFDKVARILGLGYPGGPAIAAEAAKFSIFQSQIKLPRPMLYQKNYDFSFSGLKTAVLYDFKKRPPKVRKSKEYIQEMCREVQQAIIDVLIYKTLKAARDFRAKSVILGGGVAANNELRKQFKEKLKRELPYSKFYIPDSKYCTDNAAMVAAAAFFHRKEKVDLQTIQVDANLRL